MQEPHIRWMVGELRRKLQALDALGREKSLVVAVSGGADSIALLDMLIAAADPEFPTVTAAHIHHGLRGVEADRDEAFVAEFCTSRNIPLETARLTGLAVRPGNLEAKARRARYDLLATIAAGQDASIATAHTLEDQAETLLLRLFRGAGPGGLSGIRTQRTHRDPVSGKNVRVIRPLLGSSRQDLLEWLNHRGITYRIDSSNLDEGYDRNWVRRQLLPMVRDRLNPEVPAVLASTASILSDLEEHMTEEARAWLRREGPPDSRIPELEVPALLRLSPAMRRQVVREAVRRFRGELSRLSFRHVENVIQLTRSQSGRRIDLPGGVQAVREFDFIRLVRIDPCPPFAYPLSLPGTLQVPETGTTISISKTPSGERPTFRTKATEVTIRNRRPGDSLHAGGSKPIRLKAVLQRRRIPVSTRDRLLLLESQGRIVWVEGLPNSSKGVSDSEDLPGWSVKVFETFRR